MYKPPSSLGSGAVHNFASTLEPGWTHNHDLSALPVDFAFFYMLVLKMVEQTTRQQRQQNQ
jgi:argininosuccinate lyase